jgi:hypothetical protein
VDKDKCRKPDPDAWREHASEYEQGFIDGMQEQMKRSVDRAVNALADKREWVGLTDDDRAALREMATFIDETDCSQLLSLAEERLKEKNG